MIRIIYTHNKIYIVNDTSNVSSDVYSVLTNNNIVLTDNEFSKETKAFYIKNQTPFSVVPNYRLMLHTSSINAEQNKGILGGYSD